MSEDSSAGEVTVCMLYNLDLTPNRDRNFSDSYHIQACPGTHCASLLNGYWSLVSWAKNNQIIAVTTHLVLRLRMQDILL